MIYMIKELFLQEHKKLWKKKSVRISFLLCVFYIVVFGSFLTYQWFQYGSSNGVYSGFGNYFDGYENIRKSQEYAGQWEGKLTDEVLQDMVSDYQLMIREVVSAHSAGDAEREHDYIEQSRRTDESAVGSWIKMLYPELEDVSQEYPSLMTRYVEPEKLTGFYERRQQKIEEFLDVFGHTEEEKDFLLRMNEKVEEPYSYQWIDGWSTLLGSMLPDFGVVMAVFIVIALSTVFSGEWHNGTGMLMLTTKNGWKETACAKVLSGIAFTVELFIVIGVGSIAAQLIYLGTAGWDMPIQYIKIIAVAPMNMLQAEIYEYAYTLLGAIGLAMFVMFFSAAAKNNFIALVSSLAVVYLPGTVENYMPLSVQRWMDLLPLAGSSTDIFRTNVFHLFGQIIWSPWLLITVPVLLGCALIPFTVGRWARRLKR